MVKAILLVILSAFIYATTCHMDKLIVTKTSKATKNINAIVIICSLIPGLIMTPIMMVVANFNFEITPIAILFLVGAVVANLIGNYLYYAAMNISEASTTTVMLQMIPIFSFLLALIVFNETLTASQIIGSIIIILSAVLIVDKNKSSKHYGRWKTVSLMLFSTFFYAVYFFMFDLAIREVEYSTCALWYQIILLAVGILLLFTRRFREPFFKAIKHGGKGFVFINILDEGLSSVASMIENYANTILPLVLVNVVGGVQGIFVFLIGVVGVKIAPKIFKEDLRKQVVLRKISCIIMSSIGLILIFV